MLVQPSKLKKGLPKKTKSLCPECKGLLDAEIFEQGGKVLMKKTCPEHGEFQDTYWSDAELYRMAEEFAIDGIGVENPRVTDARDCPADCGLCDRHYSHTALANLDLTNRCNLRCPVCFASSNDAGYVSEPSFEEITFMMETLRAQRPVPVPAIQFSGGEPTIHPDFMRVLSKARELGFSQVQVATNGITSAQNPGFAQQMVDAGLNTVYLQFDGVRRSDYVACRGRDLWDIKLRAIEEFRKVKPKPLATVLVPTILNTVNDDQVGPILKFAIENRDVIRGVNYQPAAFTGRIEMDELKKQRFTLPDLVDRLLKQTDIFVKSDFFPTPVVVPISYLISRISGQEKLAFTNHPHCGIASYLFVDDAGNAIPVTRFVDVKGMMNEMTRLAGSTMVKIASLLRRRNGKKSDPAKLAKLFNRYLGRYVDFDKMPEGLDIPELLSGIISRGDRPSLSKFVRKTLFVGGMHFQDLYNYDIDRLMRCNIHYVVPDGRLIPFCAYNGGPSYREHIERRFSVPLSQWRGGAVTAENGDS